MSGSTKIAVLLATLIIFLCLGFFALRIPAYQEEVANAQETKMAIGVTSTWQASLRETQEAVSISTAQAIAQMTADAPTLTPTPTNTSTPTLVPTPTETLTPTPTLSPSPTPTPVICIARIRDGNWQVFLQPSRGRTAGSTILEGGSQINIVARLNDSTIRGGWWPIQYGGQTNWILGQFLDPSSECDSVAVRDIADLLDSSENYQKIIQDTFFGNTYTWIDENDFPVRLKRDNDERQDYYLSLNSSTKDQVSVARLQLFNPLNVTDFSLFTSFSRASDGLGSYAGVRFHVSEDRASYYELRLTQGCKLELYQSSGGNDSLVFEDNGVYLVEQSQTTSCGDSIEDYLQIQLVGDTLTVNLNDIRFSPVILPDDPLAQFTQGSIELVSSKTDAKFYFLSVTGPQ